MDVLSSGKNVVVGEQQLSGMFELDEMGETRQHEFDFLIREIRLGPNSPAIQGLSYEEGTQSSLNGQVYNN